LFRFRRPPIIKARMRRWLAAISIFAAACKGQPAEVIVHLDSDIPIEAMNKLRATAHAASGGEDTRDLARDLPGSFGVAPPRDRAPVTLTIEGLLGDAVITQTTRTIATWPADGEIAHVYVFLADRCLDADNRCSEELACERCGCEPRSLLAKNKDEPPPAWSGGCEPQPDAGADAGVLDATPDAGPIDLGVRDAEVLDTGADAGFRDAEPIDIGPADTGPTPDATCAPPSVWSSPSGNVYGQSFPITLASDDPQATIYYTIDGTSPQTTSPSGVGDVSTSWSTGTDVQFFAENACGRSPTFAELYFIDGNVTVQSSFVVYNVDLGTGSPVAVVAPGAMINATAHLQVWSRMGCPNCFQQVVYAVEEDPQGCLVHTQPDVFPGQTLDPAFAVTAPNIPGVYQVYAIIISEFSCNAARGAYLDRNPIERRRIGIVIVR
jgi:hypothetical protein